MKQKIRSFFTALFVLSAALLTAQEAPSSLQTENLAQITKVEFAVDPGEGEHEFVFSLVYPFKENRPEHSLTVWNKNSFHEVANWSKGEFLYVDQDAYRAYNLHTKNWGSFDSMN